MHRIDLKDPLGRIEGILWRLFLKLALREITELQLLHLFYEDSFVSQTIKTLTEGKDVPSRGLGATFVIQLLTH